LQFLLVAFEVLGKKGAGHLIAPPIDADTSAAGVVVEGVDAGGAA
jgi:hypothetical protein